MMYELTWREKRKWQQTRHEEAQPATPTQTRSALAPAPFMGACGTAVKRDIRQRIAPSQQRRITVETAHPAGGPAGEGQLQRQGQGQAR